MLTNPQWGQYEHIGDPTLADAILDRFVHNAHKLELKGESMRKTQAVRADDDQSCPDLLRISPSPTTARRNQPEGVNR